MYFVYVLISGKDHELYVGLTNDLKRRLSQHTTGQVTATRYRQPLTLAYYEAYRCLSDARRRELFLKGGNGKRQLKIQIQDALKKLEYRHL